MIDPRARPARDSNESGAAIGSAAFTVRDVAPGLTLHLDSDSRRKTNLVNVYWIGLLGDDVTARSLLPNCLMRGTRTFPNLQALTREGERLFGASLSTDVRKVGERHVVQFRLEFVNDRYLPGGEAILDESIAFLRGVLREPNLIGEGFDPEVVRQEKETHRRLIEGLINDKRSFAVQRCIEESCRDEAFRLHEQGRVEDLDAIDGEGLAALWTQLLAGSQTRIYFSGDLPIEVAERALAPLLEDRIKGTLQVDPLPPLPAPRKNGAGREVTETMPLKQAKLVQSYRTGISFSDPHMPGFVIANGILGSFAHSKLFVNVRESASLSYSSSSSLERTHGLLLITSGIELARAAEARALIEKQVEDVRTGEFTDDELEATKRALDARLRMIEDAPGARMDIDLAWQVNGVTCELSEYRRSLAAVTRDQVAEGFASLSPDVVYLLAPEKE